MNISLIRTLVVSGMVATPLFAFAQTAFDNLIDTVSGGLNTIIIFLFLVATVIFLFGVVKYISAAGDEEKTKEAFKIVVERHLANNPNEILTLGQIGIEIGVSRERVRQIRVEYEVKNKVKLPFKKRYKEVIPEKELDKTVGGVFMRLHGKTLGELFNEAQEGRNTHI